MDLNLSVPMEEEVLCPKITVIGVGGAGGNAVNNMISSNLEGVEFVVADGIVELLRHESGMRDDRYFRVRKLRGS